MNIEASRQLLNLVSLYFKMAVCIEILPSGDYIAFENNSSIFTFTCSGNGTSLFWDVDEHPAGSRYVLNKGIQATPYISTPDGLIVSSQLIVPTTKANNNIAVICRVFDLVFNHQSSNPVKLILQGILDAPYNFSVTSSNTTFLFSWGAPFSLDVTDYSPDILHYILCSNIRTYECKRIPSNPECTFPSVCTMSLDFSDPLVTRVQNHIIVEYDSVIEFTFFTVNGAGNGNVTTAAYIGTKMMRTAFQTMFTSSTPTMVTCTASPINSIEYNKASFILYGAISGVTVLMILMVMSAISLGVYIRCKHKESIPVEQNNAYLVTTKENITEHICYEQNSAYEKRMDLSTENVVQCVQCEQNSAYQEANRPAHLWTDKDMEPCPAYGVVI